MEALKLCGKVDGQVNLLQTKLQVDWMGGSGEICDFGGNDGWGSRVDVANDKIKVLESKPHQIGPDFLQSAPYYPGYLCTKFEAILMAGT